MGRRHPNRRRARLRATARETLWTIRPLDALSPPNAPPSVDRKPVLLDQQRQEDKQCQPGDHMAGE
jgi:hypothetical protein